MKFLKTLLWVVIVALVVGLAARNWRDVTISLWGDLQADIKIPVLLLITFLLGFVPAWAIYRTQSWQLARRAPVTPVKPSVPDDQRDGASG